MLESHFKEMKEYIGFDDALRIRSLAKVLRPKIGEIVNRFYEVLLRHPEASAVFTGGSIQVARQRELLSRWLSEVLDGTVDNDYFKARFRIGTTHVRVGLPQRYMLLGMELIWQEINRAVSVAAVADLERKLGSLHKLITLDLTVMLQSYQLGDTERVRHAERDAMQAQLLRAEHLAEIGQLAASLAHEIKNPLAGISGAIQIIGSAMDPQDPHRDIVREILLQIGRLDYIVRDLLLYARPSRPVLREIRLDVVLQRVLVLLREEPGMRRVQVDHESAVGWTICSADEGQLEQLLINLILNAAHASEPGGRIRITTESSEDLTKLVVSDAGHGMKPEVLARALEPFFTTKAKGTGLGLAICRRIVEAHGGTMRLESGVGVGTTVFIELPSRPPKDVSN